MKLNLLIKATPFFSTLLLIAFLSFSNQKEYAKLRILIWDTPSYTVGTYIAISTGSGFILSYFLTTCLARINQISVKQSLNYKNGTTYLDDNEYIEPISKPIYENTLIERNIKDPSPTVNANFRIIGRTDRGSDNFISNNNIPNVDSINLEDQYYDNPKTDETINQTKIITSDWNDETYSEW